MAMDASYLSQQVNAIIGQLHGLFDEIGVSNHEREKREEELFNALSEALHNQVRMVTTEKKNMVEDAQRMISAIRQMEVSLDDSRSRRDYEADEDLKVTYPLSRCLQVLKEKHLQISKIHRERFEQVKKLVDALQSYSSHLESTFVRIPLPPTGPNQSIPLNFDLSPSYVDQLDAEFTRIYEEYTRRVATVKALSENIIQLWAELGTPQAQTDGTIVKHYRDSPEQLGLHEEDLARLRGRRDKLAEEKKGRERRLKELRAAVEELWGKLGVEEHEKKGFLNGNRGCGMRQINEFEDELARLNELKRQHLPAFVEDARCKLQELWDVLYLSEDEMLDFTPAFSDVYSDALLEAHEREIGRLEALREQRAPTLAMVDRHQSLIRERDDLAASSQDASRLMMRGQKGEKRDPGKLLREEKMRKRIAKELPKVTAELRRALETWEDEYGRPFLVHGERYLDTVYEDGQGGGGAGSKTGAAPQLRSKTPAPGAMRTASVKRVPTVSSGSNGSGISSSSSSSNNSNNNTIGRAGLGQQRPVSRAGAKTPVAPSTAGGGTAKRIPVSASASSKMTSPSRIPAATTRAPLGTLKHGTNSPERPRAGAGTVAAVAATVGGGGGMLRPAPVLMRAPPPKMRDLMAAKVDQLLETPAHASYQRAMGPPGSGINVRHVDPEDVYDDRESSSSGSSRSQSQQSQYGYYAQQQQQQQLQHQQMASGYHHHQQAAAAYQASRERLAQASASSVAGSVRHISNTSTAVSGSENWETYDDNSEPEPDVSEEYYAKMRAARGKRMTPEDECGQDGRIALVPTASAGSGGGSMAKRIRGIPPPTSSAYAGHMMMDADGSRVVSGSEWTDEDAF